jgi:hypothetical protein
VLLAIVHELDVGGHPLDDAETRAGPLLVVPRAHHLVAVRPQGQALLDAVRPDDGGVVPAHGDGVGPVDRAALP